MTTKPVQKAGAIILSNADENKIALLYRGKHNDWSFPKGHIEDGENATDAMIREIKEETGLSVKILRELPEQNYLHRDGKTVSIKMFLVQSEDDNILRPEFETDSIKWVSLDDVISVLTHDNLKEYFEKIFHFINPKHYKNRLVQIARAGSYYSKN